jgi:hypothetical protein
MMSFISALTIVLIYTTLSVGFNSIKIIAMNRLNKLNTNKKYLFRLKILDALLFSLDILVKYTIMLLMMTMNGWVNLIIAFGMVLGYIIFLIDN